MGYYTQYSVDVIEDAVSESVLATLISSDEVSREALHPNGDSRDFVKWYEHEETLCSWSAGHPNAIFRLHAEGEDSDGIWDKYFKGGKLVHIEMFSGLPRPDLR